MMVQGVVELTVITINQPVKFKTLTKVAKWIKLRNKLLAQLIGGFLFCLIIGYAIFDVFQVKAEDTKNPLSFETMSNNDDIILKSIDQIDHLSSPSSTVQCRWISKKLCSITCSSGSIANLAYPILGLINKKCLKSQLSLTLSNITFPNQVLPSSDWLPTNLTITTLHIQNCPGLEVIEPGSFAALTKLKTLKLYNINITELTSEMFMGTHQSLQNLRIAKIPLKHIHTNALATLAKLIEFSLEEIPCSFRLENLTGDGTTSLSKLKMILLRLNNVPTSIVRSSFTGLSSVTNLYLTGSKIESIGSGSFDSISSTVQRIDLQENLLKSLPPRLFDGFARRSSGWQVFLADNPWRCDCSLEYLRRTLINGPKQFPGSAIKCSNDPFVGVKVIDVEILNCDLNCNDTVRAREFQIQIEDNRPDGLGVTVESTFDTHSTKLIWIDGTQQYGFIPTNNRSLLKTLKTNETYIFCVLLTKNTSTISPFDCVPYHLSAANGFNNANDVRNVIPVVMTTLISALAFLVGFLLGCMLMKYCFARRSKVSFTGTPISGWRFETVHQKQRKIYQRSISDISITTTTDPSYVLALSPTDQQISEWPLERQRPTYGEKLTVYVDRSKSFCLPPLPPLRLIKKPESCGEAINHSKV